MELAEVAYAELIIDIWNQDGRKIQSEEETIYLSNGILTIDIPEKADEIIILIKMTCYW